MSSKGILTSSNYGYYTYDIFLETKHPILLAFSFYTNGKNILKTTKQSDQILCFNGIKVVSMIWVILGHRYLSFQDLAVNKEEVTEVTNFFIKQI